MADNVIRGFMVGLAIPPLVVTFQFNPESIRDKKAVTYRPLSSERCGCAPGLIYVGGGDRTISFEFKLDGLEQGMNKINPSGVLNGISTELAKLRSFVYPTEDPLAAVSALFGGSNEEGLEQKPPPTCYFGFGSRVLECWLTNLDINETQFNSVLEPVSAEVSVTLVVNESCDNLLFKADKVKRIALTALGLQSVQLPIPLPLPSPF